MKGSMYSITHHPTQSAATPARRRGGSASDATDSTARGNRDLCLRQDFCDANMNTTSGIWLKTLFLSLSDVVFHQHTIFCPTEISSSYFNGKISVFVLSGQDLATSVVCFCCEATINQMWSNHTHTVLMKLLNEFLCLTVNKIRPWDVF